MNRCKWVPANNEKYEFYHDTEWGVPVFDDTKLFEFLVLEGAQAGLSWDTILKRRREYTKAFAKWDVVRVSQFDEQEINTLLQNQGIIRNKLKIKSAINNAKKFIEVQKEFGSFSNYMWQFVAGKPVQNEWKSVESIPSKTKISEQISKDLKKRGFTFVGPTIIYAHMQATGMVNDHTTDCFRHNQVSKVQVK